MRTLNVFIIMFNCAFSNQVRQRPRLKENTEDRAWTYFVSSLTNHGLASVLTTAGTEHRALTLNLATLDMSPGYPTCTKLKKKIILMMK